MGTPRSDFDEAGAYYVKVVAEVASEQWSLPARGTQSPCSCGTGQSSADNHP
jgi:hypothetical protein